VARPFNVLTSSLEQNVLHSSSQQVQKTHPKIQPSSPYLGGEMGRGYVKMQKNVLIYRPPNAAMTDIEVQSSPLCSPDIDM
jgi:hypothetical protein